MHPDKEHDDVDEPRANSPEDLGWTPDALRRYAGGTRRDRERDAPLSARSAKAVIEEWLAGEEP